MKKTEEQVPRIKERKGKRKRKRVCARGTEKKRDTNIPKVSLKKKKSAFP